MSIKNRLRQLKQGNGERPNPTAEKPSISDKHQTRELSPAAAGFEVIRDAERRKQAGQHVESEDLLQAIPAADFSQLGPLLEPSAEEDLLSLEQPPAKKPERDATVAGAASPIPDAEKAGSSIEVSVSSPDIENIKDPQSGAYDDTVYSEETPLLKDNTNAGPVKPPEPPRKSVKPSNLAQLIDELKRSKAPLSERIARVDGYLKEIHRKLRENHTDEEVVAILKTAQQKQPEERDQLENYVIDVKALLDLKREFMDLKGEVDKERQMDKVRSLQDDLSRQKNGSDRPPPMGEDAKATAVERPKVQSPPPAEVAPAPQPMELDGEMAPARLLESEAEEREAEEKSTLGKFFTNRHTWGIGLIGAYTGALLYTDSFQKLAETAEWLWNTALNQPAIQVTANTTMAAYGALIGGIFVFSEIGRRIRVRKEAKNEQRRVESDKSYGLARQYTVEKLNAVLRSHSTVDSQQSALSSVLKKNEKLLTYLDIFSRKYPETLEGIFTDVRMPSEIRAPPTFNFMLEVASRDVLMRKYFKQLAPLLNNPRERAHMLNVLCNTSPFFSIKIAQLFPSDADAVSCQNSSLYKGLKAVRFNFEDESKPPEIMAALLQELYHDYRRLNMTVKE